MAVIGFARPKIRREGTLSQDKEAGSVREYRREFIVHTDNRYDGPTVVLAAPGLPQLYFPYVTLYEQDDFALCTRVHASPLHDKSPFTWQVEADYSTAHEDEKNNEEDPLREPADISFDFESSRVPVTGSSHEVEVVGKDENGQGQNAPAKDGQGLEIKVDPDKAPKRVLASKGIVNSAGEPFDPAAEIEASRAIITITRNERYFSPLLAMAFQDAVNSDSFLGADPRQAKIKGIKANRQVKGAIRYWRVTYEIAFNRETWDLQLLDHGSYHFAPARVERDLMRLPNFEGAQAVKAYRDQGGTDTVYEAQIRQDAISKAEWENNNLSSGKRADGSEQAPEVDRQVPFLDDDGNRCVGLLDGKSRRLEKGKDAVFLRFRVLKELPFSILQLPQSIRA